MHPDEGYTNFLKIYSEYAGKPIPYNEADTRAKIIDRVLKESLGWPESCIKREDHTDTGFTDYQLHIHNRCQIIIEAKKAGRYFAIPAAKTRRNYKIGGILQTIPKLAQALQRAHVYCDEIGCKYAAVFNGYQMIIFASITIGKSWKDGYSTVFNSFDDIKDHFATLWNILSYESVQKGSLVSFIDIGKQELSFKKLIQEVHNPDQLWARNDLYTYIIPISSLVFSELLDEARTYILKECYVYDRSNAQVGDELQTYFVDKLPHFATKYKIKEIVERGTKSGAFQKDLLRKSRDISKGSTIVLLGGVGAGKSTFLRRFFKIVLADHENLLWFNIDFRHSSFDENEIEPFIFSEISEQWDGKYSPKLSQLLNKVGFSVSPEQTKNYYEKLFNLLHQSGFSIILIIDNVDQCDIHFQEKIFTEASHLANIFKTLNVMSLREETFITSTRTGVFDAYDIPKFHISSPPFVRVINSRLDFTINVLNSRTDFTLGQIPTLPQSYLHNTKTRDNLVKYFKIIKDSFNSGNNQCVKLNNLVESITAGNIREALSIFNDFTISGNTNVKEIFDIYNKDRRYQIAYHQFIKSIMLGERKYYIQDKSKLINIFDFDTSITDSHYHLFRILNYLNNRINTRSGLARGYVSISQLIFSAEEISIRRAIIIDSLQRLAHFNLIEFDNQSRDNIETASYVKITYSGIHYLQELLFEFIYLDSVLIDTPISDNFTYNFLKGHINDIALKRRLERTEAFARYLYESENREFSDHPEYLGHELTSRRPGSELFERFPQIKEAVLSSAESKGKK